MRTSLPKASSNKVGIVIRIIFQQNFVECATQYWTVITWHGPSENRGKCIPLYTTATTSYGGQSTFSDHDDKLSDGGGGGPSMCGFSHSPK